MAVQGGATDEAGNREQATEVGGASLFGFFGEAGSVERPGSASVWAAEVVDGKEVVSWLPSAVTLEAGASGWEAREASGKDEG